MKALGVYLSMKEAWRFATGRESLRGVRVAVQGFGGVGESLCQRLHADGAAIIVADLLEERLVRAEQSMGGARASLDEILFSHIDIVAPCALGGVLDAQTVSRIQARVVCGAANNQLATVEDGESLRARGVCYAPDYVVKAGGIISVALEHLRSGSEREVRERIAAIPVTLRKILETASAEALSASDVADRMAREKIVAGTRQRGGGPRRAAPHLLSISP